jgi:hypothetical protein
MEFATLAGELDFFKSLGLDVGAVEVEIPLRPTTCSSSTTSPWRTGAAELGGRASSTSGSTDTGSSVGRVSANFGTASSPRSAMRQLGPAGSAVLRS